MRDRSRYPPFSNPCYVIHWPPKVSKCANYLLCYAAIGHDTTRSLVEL
jgi:hypothetical protein